MKTNYNTAAIMRHAWNLYHAADLGDGVKPVFSLCLAMAWDSAKCDPARTAARWNALQPLQQMDICAAAVRKYSRRLAADVRFSLQNMAEDLIQETWIELYQRMDPAALAAGVEKADREGRRRPSLENLAYNAAAAAVRKYTVELMEARNLVDDITDDDGHTVEAVDLAAVQHAVVGELVNRPTEKAAVDHVRLVDFLGSRDAADIAIIEGIRDGYTEREIAARLGTMTQQAVNKRRRRLVRDMMEAGIMPSYYPAAV